MLDMILETVAWHGSDAAIRLSQTRPIDMCRNGDGPSHEALMRAVTGEGIACLARHCTRDQDYGAPAWLPCGAVPLIFWEPPLDFGFIGPS